MVEPTGYTALDLIGFTDKGGYDPTANYVKNDIVTVGNTKWRCKIDDTTGVTPAENANWTIYLESATSLAGMSDVTLTSPKNGDGLVHDGNDWKNVPIMTQAQNVATGVHQFLYNRVKSSQVVGGLTITPNTDGSFTVGAGTATSNAQLLVSGIGTGSWSQAEQKLPIGEYYATCEGGTEGIYLKVMVEENNQQITVYDSGQESFVVSSAPSNLIALIQVVSGTEIPTGGIVLKPLLRLQSDSSKEISSYAKTNRELTEDVSDISKRFANNFKFLGEIDASQIDNIGSTFFPEINTGSRCYYSFGYVISGTGECWVNGYEYKGGMYGFQIRYLFNGTVMKRYKNNSNTWSSWENV